MSGMQKRKLSKHQPECVGRMVSQFDMDGSAAGNKIVMDKHEYNGSSLPSCPRGLAMSSEEDEVMLSQLRKNSSRKPMKILLENELSKEVDSKHAPPNLVARLMGLDTLPKRQINTFSGGREDRGGIMMDLAEPLSSRPFEPDLFRKSMPCEIEPGTKEFVSNPYYHKEMKNDEQDIAFFGHKNFHTRHLSANQNVDSSEESEGAVENFKANKDLFLKFIQQPNSLFAQGLHEMSTRSPSGMKRITVLKPSKTADNSRFSSKITEKWVSKPAQVNQATTSNKTNIEALSVSTTWKTGDDHQPTRIVVLKPCSEKANHTGDEFTSPYLSPRILPDENYFRGRVQHEAQRSRDMAKEVTNIIRESLGNLQMDDAFLSSVVSSGYNGDESSPNKSENGYAAESDGELMSPTSRYSWDYIDQFASCSSSISRVPHARESSVCKEAKKRLSRRWNAMGLNEHSQGYRHARSHSSNTLGEMLALSEIKRSIRSPDTSGELMGSAASLNQTLKKDETAVYSQGNLMRSNSLPLSTAEKYEWANDEMSYPAEVELPDGKELQKNNSLKQLVANIFFTRNKKSDKETSAEEKIARGTTPIEMGLLVAKPMTTGNIMESQDQPSPISVLEPVFGDDDSRSADSSGILTSEHPAVMKTSVYKTNSPMVGKSPLIESMTRTLCMNNSYVDTPIACPFNVSLVCSEPEEEQDWNILVQALLSTVGVGNYRPSDACVDLWDAPQSSLDPLLRDMYANAVNHFIHGTKLRSWRANRKLIFDSVNQALKDMSQPELECNMKNGRGNPDTILPLLVDQVWATLSKWVSSNARCVPTDDEDELTSNLVVHRVVREEVAGKRWMDSSFMNTTTVGIDIQQKLLDELLEETVLLLATRWVKMEADDNMLTENKVRYKGSCNNIKDRQ